jgi:SET domain-containing protein
MIIIEEDNAPDTYVKESTIEGYGLFASKDFNEGELIVDYTLFSDSWYEMKYIDLNQEQIRKKWYVMIDSEICITSDKFSKFSYMNHSRNANCDWKIQDRKIFANRNIKKGEELFIDYRLEPRPNREKFPDWI